MLGYDFSFSEPPKKIKSIKKEKTRVVPPNYFRSSAAAIAVPPVAYRSS